MSISTLSRQNVQQLTPYQSARRLGGNGQIWLNANEYAISPQLQLRGEPLNRYPDPQPQELLDSYARYVGLKSENVLVSRGGDEAIELLIRAFCEPRQDAVLFCPPTYGMYSVTAETNNVEQITVNQTADFQLNLAEIRRKLDENSQIKVVFICNPNNPTGTLLNRADVLEVLEMTRNRAVVVVDEAYIEFSPADSIVSELPNYPHLAIIRTLSKAFALAGLRCGFVLASPELIHVLNKVIAPYPIPAPVADLAVQALTEKGIETVRERAKEVVALRIELQKSLEKLPQVEQVYPAAGNYLLVKFKDGNKVFNALLEQGIVLRNQHTATNLANCIRITIGTKAENDAVVRAIAEL